MVKTIKVDYLARVEGEGALTISFDGDEPKAVELNIFEPPRFFESLLEGRSQLEVPDITARICGICPVAYQMSSVQAIERLAEVGIAPEVATLRRLLYAGEWIASHSLHMFMLHAPDFLGYADAAGMAKDHPELVKTGLRVKKAGNSIMNLVGGREIHPINVRVGGFYRCPDEKQLAALLPELIGAREAMQEAARRFASFDFPEFERDYEFVAMRESARYPFCDGRIVSNKGLDIPVEEYELHFTESHEPHSNALFSRLNERGAYVCGPLARLNLNFDRLGALALDLAKKCGFSVPCANPFRSLLARAIETVQALDEAAQIVQQYRAPTRAFADVEVRAGRGYGCTEAPRGLLYHRYDVDRAGLIQTAKIVPPTSQNQKSIELDLFELAKELAKLPHADATWRAEQAVRNYDPCISCATHFLQLKIEGR